MLNKYTFREYSEKFPVLFQNEKKRLQGFLSKNTVIEHIGSTSVPGLGGKGIIDICVCVPVEKIYSSFKKILEAGYVHDDDQSIDWAFFFSGTRPDDLEGKRRYHIHLSHIGSSSYQELVDFREYLKSHPDDMKRYEQSKRYGSRLADGRRSKYVETKEPVIKDILAKLNSEMEKLP